MQFVRVVYIELTAALTDRHTAAVRRKSSPLVCFILPSTLKVLRIFTLVLGALAVLKY